MNEQSYIKDLITIFPENSKIPAEEFRQTLVDIFNNEKYCQNIITRLYKRFEDFFPYPTNEQWADMSDNETYCKTYMDEKGLIYDWSKDVEVHFILAKGHRRTYDEACELAADYWMEKLFVKVFQDNGDRSGHSDTMQMLGSLLKVNASEGISDEVKNKVKENLIKYYKDHCIYKDNDGHTFHVELYCDYGPNTPLYYILKNSGIPENKINSICPWKTGIEIDDRDNAVVIKEYGKREYI
ncbi:MAG: hypothetical protein IKO36_05675 [Bacteroidaceae bacterium]|nr:hypothetical protein [Bacteroidaceae bacterium]